MSNAHQFEARASDDEVKTDLELTCIECGAVLCDIEDGDNLGTLVSVTEDHKCSVESADVEALEEALARSTNASIDTEEQEVKIALKLMCLRAKIVFGDKARYIVLTDSDQGTWANVVDVQDEEGDGITEDGYWEDGDEYAAHLYDSRVYVWKPYLQEGSWGGKYNPGQGILDIEKVMAAIDKGDL